MKIGNVYLNRHCGGIAEVMDIDYTYGHPVVCYTYSHNEEVDTKQRWALHGLRGTPSWDSCWELVAIAHHEKTTVLKELKFYGNHGSHVMFSNPMEWEKEHMRKMRENYIWGEPQDIRCAPGITVEKLKEWGTVGLYTPIYEEVESTVYELVPRVTPRVTIVLDSCVIVFAA